MALLQRNISTQGAAILEMYVNGTCIPYLILVIDLTGSTVKELTALTRRSTALVRFVSR
jgi:hypothetical protein